MTTQKRSFAAVPDFITKLANETPGQEEQLPSLAPTHEVQASAPVFRERDATQKMTVNMPKQLYEQLRAYMKLTDVPMSDILVEGARRELERLSAKK